MIGLGATTTDNGNIFTNNIGGDIYNQSQNVYDDIDNTLTFNVAQELTELNTNLQNDANLVAEIDTINPYDPTNKICYVDVDNTNPTQTGNTWNRAFNDLQDCLDKVNTDEIWVKSGTYLPTVVPDWKTNAGKSGNKHYSFVTSEGDRIYGGFTGIETDRSERDWVANPTYLSCKVTSNVYCSQIMMGADDVIVDGFIFIDSGRPINSNRRRMANSLTIKNVLSSTATNNGGGI